MEYAGRSARVGRLACSFPPVLYIDDDPLVLRFYRSFLDPHGERTLTATESHQGFAFSRRDHPDVILLEVVVRGLSGFDIC